MHHINNFRQHSGGDMKQNKKRTFEFKELEERVFLKSDQRLETQLRNETPPHSRTTDYAHSGTECYENNDCSESETDSDSSCNSRNTEIVKYKFDEVFLSFIQNFTSHCQSESKLIFDGDTLFEETYFPQHVFLTGYVPINVVAQKTDQLSLQIPSSEDYSKLCPVTPPTDKEDNDAFYNPEARLRDHVCFILNSVHCPNLLTFTLESISSEQVTKDCPADRLSIWNVRLSSFISRHSKSLRRIEIQSIRSKSLSYRTSQSNINTAIDEPLTFPKLWELTLTFWDQQNVEGSWKQKENEDKWMPDWFPDSVDQYWISLMKAQLHGHLTKLCWTSAASLCWNSVFQPIIDANQKSLETIHVIDIGGNSDTTSTEAKKETPPACSTRTVLSCIALMNVENLKELYLRKANCYLVDLHKLPQTLKCLSIDNCFIESKEIMRLASLQKLEILRLVDNSPPTRPCNSRSFGVNKETLKVLLHFRRLQELCVWGHHINLDSGSSADVSNDSFQLHENIISALGKMNPYLAGLLYTKLQVDRKRLGLQHSTDSFQTMKNPVNAFSEDLCQIGFMDETCIVVHPD